MDLMIWWPSFWCVSPSFNGLNSAWATVTSAAKVCIGSALLLIFVRPSSGFQISQIFRWKPIFQIALASIFMGEKYFQEFGPIFMGETYFQEFGSCFHGRKLFSGICHHFFMGEKYVQEFASVFFMGEKYFQECASIFSWVKNIFRICLHFFMGETYF